MGLSIPFENLKQYMWIDIDNFKIDFTASTVKYLWASIQDFSEINELVFLSDMTSQANIKSDISVGLNRVTNLATHTVTGANSYEITYIDVSTRNGTHELTVLWDVEDLGGMPGFALFNDLMLYGKRV